MNISKIFSSQNNQAFSARTTIKAPETLLNDKDRQYFEKLGSSIGQDSDTIEISISDLKASPVNPQVQIYEVQDKRNIKTVSSSSKLSVPYIKNGQVVESNSPKNFLTKLFEKLSK